MTRLPVVRCDFLARRCKRRVGAPEMRRPGSRVKRGHSFGLHKHDRCSCFDLRRNCCFVCRYNGTDRAGLDPKALLARKPERPALHRCQCGAARECWNCNRSRVANRNGAWLFQIEHMKLAVSAKVLPESSEYFRSSKSMSGPAPEFGTQARRSAAHNTRMPGQSARPSLICRDSAFLISRRRV